MSKRYSWHPQNESSKLIYMGDGEILNGNQNTMNLEISLMISILSTNFLGFVLHYLLILHTFLLIVYPFSGIRTVLITHSSHISRM